jgi:hypothetical protein
MKTWTLTITGGCGFNEHTIIGAGENTERAGEQLFTAAAAIIRRPDIDERPRYTLQLGETSAAPSFTKSQLRGFEPLTPTLPGAGRHRDQA